MDKIKIPFSEFILSFSRSGGPGGQNVNKINSKVILDWDMANSPSLPEGVKDRFRQRFPGCIHGKGMVQIVGQKHRTQKANIDDCIAKLHVMINEVLLPPKLRKKTKPRYSAVMKRLESKKKDSQKKRLRRGDY